MSSTHPAVGIIGGTGWLGRNIGRQALAAGIVAPERLLISSRSGPGTAFGDWPGVRWTADSRELVASSEVVVLSVRPQDFRDMDFAAEGKLVISVMAGISLDTLVRRSRSQRVVRTMPNAAVEIGRSYTPWFAAPGATQADRNFTQRLFAACGTADEVKSETDLDYLTGLSGAGPAWAALLADAMLSHALEQGLDRDVAERAVKGAVCDASGLLGRGTETPGEVVRTFRDYRGTTAAGLDAMIDNGFTHAVGAGLAAAARAARDMAAEAERSGASGTGPR